MEVQAEAPGGNANPEQPEEQKNVFVEIVKKIAMFMIIQSLIGFIFKGGKDATPQPPATLPQNNSQGVVSGQGGQQTTHLYNLLRPHTKFDIDVYLSFDDHVDFFYHQAIVSHNASWSERDLYYEYLDSNDRAKNISFPVPEKLRQNETMYLHMQVIAPNPLQQSEVIQDSSPSPVSESRELNINRMNPQRQNQQAFIKLNATVPLVKYMPKQKDKKLKNLFETQNFDLPPSKEEAATEPEDSTFFPHFKNELYLYLVYDPNVYTYPGGIPPQFAEFIKVYPMSHCYEPIMYLSDFWLLKRDMTQINSTVEQLNLTLHFNTYSLNYFTFIKQYEQQQGVHSQYGLDQGDPDEIERMILETDPILLGVTMIVSLLHTVFEMLAFKNDINFWREKDSMEGISVKTLYTQFFCAVIIFLYLMDSETSYLILLSSGFGLLLDVWKIKKASKVIQLEKFPYYWLEDKDTYVNSETKIYDAIAMRYMSYALYPLMAGYSIYSVVYNEHKGWYSYVINTLVGAIYLFGFIQMTPQLYINYRLKTVEHMPSKALFYRFLNTIIDDLFSFIITMPTLHRISCFRDDVIFVIYLYQRWIYRVDKTRGPYAERKKAEEEEQKKLAEAGAPSQEVPTEVTQTVEEEVASKASGAVKRRGNKTEEQDAQPNKREDGALPSESSKKDD